jgi:GxxExxY protein
MDDLSYETIGKAMEVHRQLGPGLDELFYHELLAHRLQAAGIHHEYKPRGKLVHKGIVADEFEADLLVGDKLVLELKVLWERFHPEHSLQIICYQKFRQRPIGLLLDFGKESLFHKRIACTPIKANWEPSDLLAKPPALVSDRDTLLLVAEGVQVIAEAYGLGYRASGYRGLLHAEFAATGTPSVRQPTVAVRAEGLSTHQAQLDCIVVNGRCAVKVTALQDLQRAADRAILQTCLRLLNLPWGLVVNFGKHRIKTQFAATPRSS